jgi:hypothetical protein
MMLMIGFENGKDWHYLCSPQQHLKPANIFSPRFGSFPRQPAQTKRKLSISKLLHRSGIELLKARNVSMSPPKFSPRMPGLGKR